MTRSTQLPVLTVLVLLGACGPADSGSSAAKVPAEAVAAIDTAALMTHIRALADDSMLGRAPGSLGETRTVAYLEAQFRAMGLAPGNTDGTYIQNGPLVAITADPAMTLAIIRQGIPGPSSTATTSWPGPGMSIRRSRSRTPSWYSSGMGWRPPSSHWDDFKGAGPERESARDAGERSPLADTPQFRGKAMTYYGRWTYKYEQGQRQKARACF